MGYYMRFFDTSAQPLNLRDVDSALRGIDPEYRVEIIPETDALQGELHYTDGLYGEIEINQPGDGLFDVEIEEQLESLEDAEGGDPALVVESLRVANRSIVVRVLSQGRESNDTLLRLDPLWAWLFNSRLGLLQADGEGFYDSQGMVLETHIAA
jgi:hypothetical protein